MSELGRSASRHRQLTRILLVTAIALLLVLVAAGPAHAHATLLRSDPPGGAILEQTPSTAQLWFSDDLVDELSTARVLDRAGRDVGAVIGLSAPTPGLLLVSLRPLRAGSYGLAWSVVDAEDGHRTSGVVVFSVGATATGAPVRSSITGESGVVLHWLALLALAAALGGFLVDALVLRPVSSDTAGRRLPAIRQHVLLAAFTGASGAVVIALIDLLSTIARASGGVGATVHSLFTGSAPSYGERWLAGTAALVCLAVVALRQRRDIADRQPSRLGVHLTGCAAVVVAAVGVAWASHAAVAPDRMPALLATTVHVLCACTWLAGLATVLWCWFSLSSDDRGALLAACRLRVSIVLMCSVGLLVASGLYATGVEVSSASDLVRTTYGLVVLAKIVLVTAMTALGLTSSVRLHGGGLWRSDQTRRTARVSPGLVAAEALAGTIALLAAALLISTSPHPSTAGASTEQRRTTEAGDLVVTVAATPGRPGENWFSVIAASSRRPAPAPIDGVDLVIDDGSTTAPLTLRQIAPDTFVGIAELASADRIGIDVRIHRAGQTIPMAVRLSSTDETAPPVAPLSSATTPLAFLVLVALAGLLAVVAVRRRSTSDRGLGGQRDLEDRTTALTVGGGQSPAMRANDGEGHR